MRRILLALLAVVLSSATLLAAPASAAAPDAPGNVAATLNGNTTIDATWDTPLDSGGFALDTYSVTIAPAHDTEKIVAAGTNAASFTGLQAGVAYTVSVTATNQEPTTSEAGTSPVVTTPAAPAAPATPTATLSGVNNTQVTVTWVAPANNGSAITSYTVDLSNGDQLVIAGTPPATTATFTAVAPGTSVTATVIAENGVSPGPASGSSNSVTTASAPGAPTGLGGTAGVTTIDLTWVAAAANGDAVDEYIVTYTPAGGVAATKTGIATTSTQLTGLAEETSYTITVRAKNGIGDSLESASIVRVTGTSATVPATPAAPTATLSGANNTQVTITWVAPANNGKVITSYTVDLSNGAQQIVSGSPPVTSVTFTSVAAGASVTATVSATNVQGTSAPSASSNSVKTAAAPGAPTGLVGTWAGSTALNSIDLSWVAPALNNGDAIDAYVITVSPPLTSAIPDVVGTSTRVSGFEQGQTYTIWVAAKNGIGTGIKSSAAVVEVPTTPGAVRNIAVAQQPPFGPNATITWDAPEDVGGAALTGFVVVVAGQTFELGATARSVVVGGLKAAVLSATVQPITLAGEGPTSSSPSFEVRAFAPFNNDTEFVEQLYADFLKRTPDAAGLAYWVGLTNDDGSNIEDIIQAFMNSPEFSPRRAVTRVFLAYFNRQPDKGGFDYWTALIATGQAELQTVSDAFAGSAEFQLTYGALTNGEFVVLVYNNVLARTPDLAGFNYWLVLLNNGVVSRGQMMTQFSESPEFVGKSRPAVDVTVTYDGMLQREADIAGFKFWRDQVSGNEDSLAALLRNFYESQEYADRVDR